MRETAPFEVLGVIESGFREKFGIPKQSQIAKPLTGKIVFENSEDIKQALQGVENFSHLWILYIFHEHAAQKKYRTRPPRLGGETSVGVFASRASHRPNPIAMSVVELLDIHFLTHSIELNFKGVDMLNGSWVIDIKPYIKNYDCITEASDGWVEVSEELNVEIPDSILENLQNLKNSNHLKEEILTLLKNDPRPAYLRKDGRKKEFALTYKGLNIVFVVNDKRCTVIEIEKVL